MYCTSCGKEIVANASVCPHCGVAVGMEKKFCANCGQAVNYNQAICLGCGNALTNGPAAAGGNRIMPSGKSASTAAILSCLIVGLGQIYLGQIMKGVVMLLVSLILGSMTFGVISLVMWVVSIIDASKIGQKLEAGQSVGEWEFF